MDVDDETGEIEVIRIVAAHDCGTPINPMLVEGQIEGGIAMGIGFALQEEILFDNAGRQINPNLTNYICRRRSICRCIEVDIVENYDPTGPFGAKGVGEPTSGADRRCHSQRDPRCCRRARYLAAGYRRKGARRDQGKACAGAEAYCGACRTKPLTRTQLVSLGSARLLTNGTCTIAARSLSGCPDASDDVCELTFSEWTLLIFPSGSASLQRRVRLAKLTVYRRVAVARTSSGRQSTAL